MLLVYAKLHTSPAGAQTRRYASLTFKFSNISRKFRPCGLRGLPYLLVWPRRREKWVDSGMGRAVTPYLMLPPPCMGTLGCLTWPQGGHGRFREISTL